MRSLFTFLILVFCQISVWANVYEYAWSRSASTEADPVIASAYVDLPNNTGFVTTSTVVNVTGNVPLDGYALMEGGTVTPFHITQTGFEVLIGANYPGNDTREFNDLLSGNWTFVPAPVPDKSNTLLLLIFSAGTLVALIKFRPDRYKGFA